MRAAIVFSLPHPTGPEVRTKRFQAQVTRDGQATGQVIVQDLPGDNLFTEEIEVEVGDEVIGKIVDSSGEIPFEIKITDHALPHEVDDVLQPEKVRIASKRFLDKETYAHA